MFVRLSRYIEVVERAARAEALASELAAAQKEVRRLTDVIIHLKREDRVLDPVQSDERWPGGRYTFTEIEAESQPLPRLSDEQVDEAEAELRAELARVFDEE